jgi:hypothetical protein
MSVCGPDDAEGGGRVIWADDCEIEYVIEDLKEENAKLKEQVQEAEYEESRAWDIVHGTELRNDKWKALCRDMMLVVELIDLDHMALRGHGKDADWRTLKERYYELTVVTDEKEEAQGAATV